MESISLIKHPDYVSMMMDWDKYRRVWEGGREFIRHYLKKFSREDSADFNDRMDVTYNPSHARSAIEEIKNSIFSRMVEIRRIGGPANYQDACLGLRGGVDNLGNTMSSFVGIDILPELLVMKRVGVFIDKPSVSRPITIAESNTIRPYLYYYAAEDILSWNYDAESHLTALLLRDHANVTDENDLVTGEKDEYRLVKLTPAGVSVTFFDANGKPSEEHAPVTLNLKQIPFVVFEIKKSLLHDVADYQIALLQLGSADMNYTLKGNFPFYTEQYSPAADVAANLQQSNIAVGPIEQGLDNRTTKTERSKTQEITTGSMHGRRYPIGTERPGFVAPPDAPLRVSMDKQEQLRKELRQLVALNLSNADPTRSSALSKEFDVRGLEAGLSYIGLVLSKGERQIAEIWSEYEGSSQSAVIHYPERYTLKTDAERRAEAKETKDLMYATPSMTMQKTLAKQVADVMLETKISNDDLKTIHNEIDASPVVVTDPTIITQDHEAGFVSDELASKLRGYPKGESEKSAEDHAKRLARISLYQSQGAAAARGVPDASGAPMMDANLEKTVSQQE